MKAETCHLREEEIVKLEDKRAFCSITIARLCILSVPVKLPSVGL